MKNEKEEKREERQRRKRTNFPFSLGLSFGRVFEAHALISPTQKDSRERKKDRYKKGDRKECLPQQITNN